jgi:hypothetical protein
MARTVLLGVMVVVFGALTSIAAPDTQTDIVGVYKCEGMNPDGTPYQGIVEIARIQETFRVRWTLGDGTSIVGVGMLSGGVFAVSYFGGAPAIAVYKIDGARLVGEWTMGGAEGAVYSETLTRMANHPAPEKPSEKKPAEKKPANFREA